MKISLYYKNNSTPSNYYRLVQYFEKKHSNLNKIHFNNTIPNKLYQTYINKNMIGKVLFYLLISFRLFFFLIIDLFRSPNYIFVSKYFSPRNVCFINKILILLLVKKGSQVIWDFDDNILFSREISRKQWFLLERISSSIIVTNDYLYDLIDPIHKNKVIKIPTTDGYFLRFDIEKIISKREDTYDKEINICYVATSGNFKYLQNITKQLDLATKILQTVFYKKVNLIVCSDRKPNINFENTNLVFVKWTRDRASDVIEKSHIGIMPLVDNEFTRGKGSFKLIQYLSSGLPIIGSKVGMNIEVINSKVGYLVEDGEWSKAIIDLSTNKKDWEIKSHSAFQYWHKRYNYDDNLKIIHELIKEEVK